MRNIYRTLLAISILTIVVVLISFPVQAGNKDRSGQAAAVFLLINPWASTNGWGTAGISHTKGIEATFSNVAGMAFTKKTEVAYTNTIYMQRANVMINNLGVVQNLGETRSGVERGNIGLTVMVMTPGKIPITTVGQPEGGLGYFSFTMMDLGLSYARSFSQAVHAGISFNLNNQTAPDISATGFTIDAGIQYVTGRNDQFQIGVALRNIGLPIRFKGDGMNVRTALPGNTFVSSLLVGTEEAEMPVLLALGVSYDFLFGDKTKTESVEKVKIKRENAIHRISVAGAFVANAYSRDQVILGVEYSFLDYFQLRGGYTIEGGMFNKESVPASNFIGPSLGTSILIPLKKGGKGPSRFAIDYSYRFTREWLGCHGIGARLIL
ncbi:MAG: PorV/PorQ family protein [Bacteroidales bacterium]|jgi:hypothetical protein|nr:PorV/PorQ family protein [Bacteroidales bacterium]